MMSYKGYLGTVEYSAEDHCLYGKLTYIRDLVNYEATTVSDLESEFQAAVDDYLFSCEELNREPNKPCRGSFNIRTDSELHRAAIIAAEDQTLNAFVCDAIHKKIQRVHPELGIYIKN